VVSIGNVHSGRRAPEFSSLLRRRSNSRFDKRRPQFTQFTGEELQVKFWRKFPLTPAKVLKSMVGPCGLGRQTSAVSMARDYVLPIT